MYYDLDDNIDNINVPDEFVEITSLLKVHRKNIRKKMIKILHQNFDEDCDDSKKQLMDIMEYAVFSGGKHYRSFFVELLGKVFSISLAKSLFIGAIIEMMHNYIIMQNAMPELENNDYRYNRETCHKRFGKAQTIIASNALYSLIIEAITDNDSVKLSDEKRCKIIKIITNYIGKDGVSGGQMMKILLKHQKKRKDEITRINKLKINSLFMAGMECMQTISGVSNDEIAGVKSYISSFCNLMNIYEELYERKSDNTNELLERAKLLMLQGKKSIKSIENNSLLLSFIEYNYYCIKKLAENSSTSNKIIVVDNSNVATI